MSVCGEGQNYIYTLRTNWELKTRQKVIKTITGEEVKLKARHTRLLVIK